jgi:flagellar biosynthetic protein FlhB
VSDDKTEEPSQKKIDDARREGNVWKSKDLSGAISFAVAMGVLKGTWSNFETQIKTLFYFAIEHISHPQNLATATQQLIMLGVITLIMVSLPIALASGITGALIDFLQVGALFTVKAVMPKLDKLNAIEGLKNLVGTKQLVELVKSIVKLSVTGYTVYVVVRDAMGMVVATTRGDSAMTMLVMGELVYRIVVRVTLLFVCFAIFDVWWQRRTYMKGQMMSKDDQKKEYKESEGDPHHKAKRKELHHEILEGAQMQAVKKADVVVTNPDHVAVALQYDKDRDGAPRVIAKGMNLRAEALKALAKEADVATLRNVPLAHALLRTEVGQEVPEDLYDAVAEVLNFVYQLKSGTAA